MHKEYKIHLNLKAHWAFWLIWHWFIDQLRDQTLYIYTCVCPSFAPARTWKQVVSKKDENDMAVIV